MSSVHPEINPVCSGSFFAQITALCNDIGCKWEAGWAGNSKFQSVTLLRSQEKVLTLVLIDYKNMLLPEGKQCYGLAIEYVSGRRRGGEKAVVLWEDQWIRNREILVSRIKALLGMSGRIPGRLTYSMRIDKSTAYSFLSQHHLQGDVSSKYKYGLFLPVRYFRVLPENFAIAGSNRDLLVAVATYSNAKIFQRDGSSHRSCELIRFANHCETTVVGGLDKLLKAFVADFQPDDIMTYADLEWSDGASYLKLGFQLVSQRAPVNLFIDMHTHIRYASNRGIKPEQVLSISNAGSRKFVKPTSH